MHQSEVVQGSHKRTHLKVTILALISLLVVGMAGLAWYHYSHRYVPGKLTFQQYQPSYWPSGLDLKNSVINDVRAPSQSPTRYTELELTMDDGSSVFQKERSTKRLTYTCPEGKIVNQSCTVGHTSKGEPYFVYTTTFDGNVAGQLINWSRADTDITIRFEKVPNGGYSNEEINKIIQSFKPATYQKLKIRHIDRSRV